MAGMRPPDEPETSSTWQPPMAPGQPPLPNRFDRATFTGCLGIACVLALPAILFLPVETWGLPEWAQRLVPLVGVAFALAGAALLSRVPAAAAGRSTDPRRPLTGAGRPPLVERPAREENRAALLIAWALVVVCVIGYLSVSFARRPAGVVVGTLLASVAGGALVVYGALALARRLPAPAWHWVRTPVSGAGSAQCLPFGTAGVVALAWALFVAAGEGYAWAPLGVGVLILGGALIGPLTQRLTPPRGPGGRGGPPGAR